MTATDTTGSTLLVAIDISKHRHEVLIGVPGKKRRRRLTITNTLDDFQRLASILADYGLPVRIGFEATGNYHRPLAHHLGRAGFELKLVSSVGLARTREALHNSWDKNDPKDAQVILHMLEIDAVQFFHDPLTVGTADIQELSKTHEIVSRSKTELWHRILTHYLPLYFPEAERFHRSSRTDWFLAFLEKYPSPHMISAMSRDAFVADAWDVVGRKVSKEQLLSDIYATAVDSVGLPVGPDSDAVGMFRLVLAEGRSLVRQRDEIEARAVELLSDLPDYQLLTTIPGIGPINAMTILAEAGDLRRFRHHRQFLKLGRHGSRHRPVRHVPRSEPHLEVRQCTATPNALDGRSNRGAEADQQLPGQVRTLHFERPTQRPSAPQGLHRDRGQDGAHRTRRGQSRRTLSPLLRGGEPRRKDLSLTSRGGSLLTS
jgi:transposase